MDSSLSFNRQDGFGPGVPYGFDLIARGQESTFNMVLGDDYDHLRTNVPVPPTDKAMNIMRSHAQEPVAYGCWEC